jgi:GTPase SAR1 family protein
MTIYFVSYSHSTGFGNCEVEIKTGIRDFGDLNEIRDKIENSFNVRNVIIICFSKLDRLEESKKAEENQKEKQ